METPKAEPTVVVDVVANEVVEDESSSSAAAPDPEEAGSSYSASDEDPPAVESGKQSDLNVSTCDIPLPEKTNDDPDPGYTCICPVEPAKQEEAGPVESTPLEQELPATQPLEEAVSDSKKRSSSDDGSQVAKKAKSQSEEEK